MQRELMQVHSGGVDDPELMQRTQDLQMRVDAAQVKKCILVEES